MASDDRSDQAPDEPDSGLAENTQEARERYRELLEEVRMIIPGIQVLFGFLLTVPFSSRFANLDTTGTALFVTSLTTAALATVVFLAPASYHRIVPRQIRRGRLRIGIHLVVAGMGLLAIAVVTAILVVVRFIYDTNIGVAVAATVLATTVTLWYLMPLVRRATILEHEGSRL
jgi:MFS family permease